MSRPAGVTRRGVAANDIVGRGMRGRGRRSRRQCSGRALLGCDRRRDFRPSARASCPTSWHSHTHTPHANNMCSALLSVYVYMRAAHSPPATHTTIILILFMDPSALIHKRALILFLRAPPKLSSAPKNCSARVIVAGAVCWLPGVGGRREEDFALSTSAADCRAAACINHRLSPFGEQLAAPGRRVNIKK